jgi:Ca2+-binding EF-hand superfamily protein
MLRRTKIISVIMIIAVFIATWAMLGTVVAQKAAVPKPQDKLALGEEEVKQLLLLMDTDKNGKISKQEWIKFMEAEFHRLDVEKRGEIDRKQLLQSTVSVGHVRSADLGK